MAQIYTSPNMKLLNLYKTFSKSHDMLPYLEGASIILNIIIRWDGWEYSLEESKEFVYLFKQGKPEKLTHKKIINFENISSVILVQEFNEFKGGYCFIL